MVEKVKERSPLRSPNNTVNTRSESACKKIMPKMEFADSENGISKFQNREMIVGGSSAETTEAEEQDVRKPC